MLFEVFIAAVCMAGWFLFLHSFNGIWVSSAPRLLLPFSDCGGLLRL